MFGSLGFPEILFILVIALLVFGPRRLPEIGRTIGKALGEFRRATGDLKRSFDLETSSFDEKSGAPPLATAPRQEASETSLEGDESTADVTPDAAPTEGEIDEPEPEDDSEDSEQP